MKGFPDAGHTARGNNNLTTIRFILILFGMVFLCGCAPDAATFSPVGSETSTASPLPAEMAKTTSPTRTEVVQSPTSSATFTRKAEPTRTDTPSRKMLPTTLPTPTRGLPPSLTPGPKEECPTPTYKKADIHFEYSIADYGSQILDYFRSYGDRAGLREAFGKTAVEFSEADIDGNQSKETLIIVSQVSTITSLFDDIGVFVVGCKGGQYQLLGDGLAFLVQAVDRKLSGIDIRDLNANGVSEIIASGGASAGDAQSTVYYGHRVYEWDGGRFRQLIEPYDSGYGPEMPESMNAALEYKDVDGNGTMELLFPWNGRHYYCSSGPHRIRKDVYMWNGTSYRYMWTDPGSPEYIFQAAFDGDYFSEKSLYIQSEKSYRRAISDPTLKPFTYEGDGCSNPKYWEPDDPRTIIAYARFRLLELLVYLGKMHDAEVEWKYLSTNCPEGASGYWYAVLAESLWEAYQAKSSIDNACEAVRNKATENPEEIFTPLYFGTVNPGPTLDTICPFHSGSG